MEHNIFPRLLFPLAGLDTMRDGFLLLPQWDSFFLFEVFALTQSVEWGP